MPRAATPPPADALRAMMQQLFRRFGALAGDTTPCGKPLSMAHSHALMVLRASPPMSQQALGRVLAIDKSNVTRLCARMVAADHVTQVAAAHDGRSRLVELTARGRRVAGEVDRASRARFTALLAAVPPAHRRDVLATLRHLLTAVDTLSTPGSR